MANIRSSLIWVYTVCIGNFVRHFGVRNFRTLTVLLKGKNLLPLSFKSSTPNDGVKYFHVNFLSLGSVSVPLTHASPDLCSGLLSPTRITGQCYYTYSLLRKYTDGRALAFIFSNLKPSGLLDRRKKILSFKKSIPFSLVKWEANVSMSKFITKTRLFKYI